MELGAGGELDLVAGRGQGLHPPGVWLGGRTRCLNSVRTEFGDDSVWAEFQARRGWVRTALGPGFSTSWEGAWRPRSPRLAFEGPWLMATRMARLRAARTRPRTRRLPREKTPAKLVKGRIEKNRRVLRLALTDVSLSPVFDRATRTA